MTGSDMRAFRKIMGWNHSDLIAFLKLTGTRASEFVHNMESDKIDISGPVQTALEQCAARHGYELINAEWRKADGN